MLRTSAPALLVLALSGPALAQGDFAFEVVPGSSVFSWSGSTSLGPIVASGPFHLEGTTALDLDSGGAPVGAGSFAGGGEARVVPDLAGEIPNPLPFLPPLATVAVVDLRFTLSSPVFAPDGAGHFTAPVTATATSGTLTFTPLVGSPVVTDLTGLSSTPSSAPGALTPALGGLDLVLAVAATFDFADPGTGVSGTVSMNGTLTGLHDCELPSTYCTALPNSVGPGSQIGSTGSTSIANNDLHITCTGLPPNKNGRFFYGPVQSGFPFGNGLRCVDGSVVRLPILNTGPGGAVDFHLDQDALPANGPIAAGETWHFQFWHRDQGFNLSDALTVRFCP